MQFDDIRITLYRLLSLPENHGRYMTCLQICYCLEKRSPTEWHRICEAYPIIKSGTFDNYDISPYCPERFVEATLKYYAMNNGIPGLIMDEVELVEIKDNQTKAKKLVWKLI